MIQDIEAEETEDSDDETSDIEAEDDSMKLL